MTSPAKWSRKQRIRMCLYPEVPVFRGETLKQLHAVVGRHAPDWVAGLVAAKNADTKDIQIVGRDGDLCQAIQRAAPLSRGLGHAVLRGRYRGLRFFLDSCETTLPPELNFISMELYSLATVEGHGPPGWTSAFFEELVSALPIRYGHAELDEEFGEKNLVRESRALRAVGVKLDISLPGLYWLNYFGRPYLNMIGEERLLSAPAFIALNVGDGVLVALDGSPLNWQSKAYGEREAATISHIGRQYFFLKAEPDMHLLSPNFSGKAALPGNESG